MPDSQNSNLPHIYLASQSPRRRQLLDALGLPFTAISSDAPEADPDASNVSEITVANAFAKAKAISDRVQRDEDVVVAADTLVVFDGRVWSKPCDRNEVVRTLKGFSGKRHLVVTGLALYSRRYGELGCPNYTWIQFRDLKDREIEDYADTKEPYDKAGSYAIQGLGSLFIEKMEGSYTNAMGLPVENMLVQLSELTQIPPHRWFQR